MYEADKTYSTRVAIPRHLWGHAQDNADLISKTLLYLVHRLGDRCKDDAGLMLVVAASLNSYCEEKERGEFKEHTAEREAEIDRANYEANHPGVFGRAEILKTLSDKVGLDRIQRAGEAMYEANRALCPTASNSDVYPTFWDDRCTDETRLQFLWAAAVVLNADSPRVSAVMTEATPSPLPAKSEEQ